MNWEEGRYEFAGLGYEDDAMIANECLFRQIVKVSDRIINIDKGPVIEEDTISEKTIGNKLVVLVDTVD